MTARVTAFLERLRRVLPALWAGALLAIALLAAPAPFSVLPPAEAGRVNARLFAHEAWLAIAVALVLWMLERRRARQAAAAGTGSVFNTEMILIAAALFCTIAGYFGVQPLLADARSGQGALSFGQLHLASVAFFAVKTGVVSALAWRAASR